MKIAILGAGSVGGNLGLAFSRQGHQVCFGVRHPGAEKVEQLLSSIGDVATATTPEMATRDADLVVVAVPFGVIPQLVAQAGDLAGKIVVDATNSLSWDNGPVSNLETSTTEVISALLPTSRLVKAFNTIGAEHMSNPDFGGQAAGMFICGDDTDAKQTVSALASAIGFEAYDAGPLRNAYLLDHMVILWIHMATIGGHGRDIAFNLLAK